MSRFRPRWPAAVRDLALPSQCAICFGWSGERICTACHGRFARPVPRCMQCALRLPDAATVCGRCLRRPPPFDQTLAAVDYGHPWAALISRFKYSGALDLADALAMLLLREVASRQPAAPPGLLLPVPASAGRLRERGYNQAWEIARRVAARLDAPADPRLLLRVRETAPQLALAPDRRAANVRGAFAVEPTRRAEVLGRATTLIDDVMTTGETAAELARVLRAAGASTVQVWVIARTPAPER